MKISKNELRKMIFETVLREQEETRPRRRRQRKDKEASPSSAPENKTPHDALLDIYKKYAAEKNNSKKKEALVQAMATMFKNIKKDKIFTSTTEERYQNFITDKVPELKALLEPTDAKSPPEAKKPTTKTPNPRIREVQKLLNSFLDNRDTKLAVNGYWKPEVMDPVMEKVMSKLKVENPNKSWKEMASELKVEPTLQGLISYLNSKKNSNNNTSNQDLGTSDPENDRADIESETEESDEEATPALSTIKTSQEVKDKVTLRMAAYEIELLDSRYRPLYFGDNEGNISNDLINYVKNKTPVEGRNKNNQELAIMILLRDTDLNSPQISAFKNQNNYAGILKAMSDKKVGFDLPGQDSEYPKEFKKDLLGALARAFSKKPEDFPNIPLNESKVIYGKSHATLLRERYWGRY